MDRRILRTRNAIKKAFVELLSENRDGKITVTEIADRANIDRKTFYLHHESVDEMIKNFSKDAIEAFYKKLRERGFFDNPYDKSAIFLTLSAIIEDDEDFYRRLAGNEGCSVFWKEIENALIALIIDVYAREDLFTKSELNICGRMFTAGAINLYKSWLMGEIGCSIKDLGIIASEMESRGIQGIIEFGKERKNKK